MDLMTSCESILSRVWVILSTGDMMEVKWKEQVKKSKDNPSLIKATVLTFWPEYGYLALLVFINETAIRLGQPLLLGRLLMYFRPNSQVTNQEALIYASGIAILNLVYAISVNQFLFDAFYYGMKVRVAMCSVIYRKALRLSRTALGDTAPGKIVNLLSNDVNRFDLVSVLIHMMWASPLVAMIVGYLLWLEVGWAGFVGIVVVFTVVPLQCDAFLYPSNKIDMSAPQSISNRSRRVDSVYL
ncbi:hypothetical protein DMENIID0001_023560 [Sergentomyia squamirostris]